MTRLFKLSFLVFALLLLVTGCTNSGTKSDSSASSASTFDRIQASGELVLGTSGNMPPMSETRADGKVAGFDIDIARLMANSMGVKLNIKTMPFNKLLSALENGEVDVVLSNVTMNPERNMKVAFVGPYLASGKCVITKRDSLAKAESVDDINSPEIRLAALRGSTSESFIKALLPKVTLTLVDDHQSALDKINSDQVGGLLTDYPICVSVLGRNPEAGYVTLFSLLSYEPIGIAIQGSDPLFINWMENFLGRLDGVGLLDELSDRWFGKAVITTREE